jgi:phage terminase small subunit
MIQPLTGKREKFCQLIAADATYTEAYQKPAGYDRKLAAEAGSRLMADTDIILRVQELRRPVIRKFRRKLEYGLQKALEQCEVAWDLAYAQGDAKTLLKAVGMQAKLAKLLTDQIDVNHRHGLLDDASTEVLLVMKRECEVRREKQRKLQEIRVVNSETDSETPHRPPFRGL